MIILLDLNGTIAADGKIKEGVKERLAILKEKAEIYILSADTFGTLNDIAKNLNVKGMKVDREKYGSEKIAKLKILEELKKLNPDKKIIAIGNGNNDELLLKNADLGICVIGDEGAWSKTILSSDIVVKDINDALDLLLNENRLKATSRD
ncbi:Haloacid dehalogenase domain protein hydrolase [Methanocaldococcus sp. FS406-22]|uniref:HAD family hydrolase n=1 Tax=Methanocaldococcus sp. (strain FS406-22) TaxID=644281 RepID=UPI0001BF098F|nr:HAD family hydrolase [Methanocaldococcus sp. FS406-22]ADC69126.1 Haloacid dehalogenase domain protein hydrolase [Methanocaldococcus sp. FS406-22]